MNLRPPGYEPDELPTALLRDIQKNRMVPVTGLEPVRYRYREILSLLCLPFHHTGGYRQHLIYHIPGPVSTLFPENIKNRGVPRLNMRSASFCRINRCCIQRSLRKKSLYLMLKCCIIFKVLCVMHRRGETHDERSQGLRFKLRFSDGRCGLGCGAGQYMGLPQQNGCQRWLPLPDPVSGAGAVLRRYHHAG